MVLSVASSGVLVAGSTLTQTGDVMPNKTVKAVRAFYYERKLVKVGDVIDLPQVFAIEVVAANKAENFDKPIAPQPTAIKKTDEKIEARDQTGGKRNVS